MCMKKNNNRLLRGVAAILCLALMFFTMSGMAMATDMEDAPAGGAPESTPEIMEAELPATPEETPDTQEPAPAPPETTETPQPEAEYALDADIPAGWHNAPVTVTVRIRDKNNAGWQKVEAALRETAERTDLTEQLAHNGLARYTVPDNGIVFFFVTDPYGTEHTLTLELRCIDLEAPVLRAGVSGTLLRVEAADTLSGIAGVYVNDELYTTLQNGEFSVRIDKNTRDSHFYIMGVDNAGNRTGYVVIANPFYEKETPAPSPTPEQHSTHCPADCDCRKQPSGNTGSSGSNTGAGKPSNASGSTGKTAAAQTPAATEPAKTQEPAGTAAPVAIEKGTGFSQNGSAVTRDLLYDKHTNKQFIAVETRNGHTLYLVIDYGYKRDPEDKHHLVIDEETAPTVRRIFAMRAAGMGFRAIAVTLNEEGVLPPGALYYQRKGRSDPRNVNHKWAETTVKALIRSEVYIGNMVQGKTGTLSYKSRKLINKPEEEWIRVEGTHEPIISREIWDTVVSIDKKKVRKTPPTDGIRSIFTGIVYCADCGFKMRNHIERFTYKDGTPGRYSSFICGNYARSGKSACTIHSIYENVLEELVLTDIREKARFVECDGERLAEQISRMKEKESRSRVISYEQELKAAAARMAELERLMQNLYEDKCTGTIPQTVFQTLMRKYETERAEKAAAIPELEQKVRAQLENRQDANRWMEVIRRYTEITALDESILFELVDRIEVGEARKVNGQRICDVKVIYRYVGSVDDALAQERLEAYEKAI